MKKLVLVAFAAFSFVSTAAIAANPDGTFVYKDNTTYDQRCDLGEYSSRIIQNGQFVSGNGSEYDQTTEPGSRADAIRSLLEESCKANGQDEPTN